MAPATPKVLPRHIAITMDGNGRWADARALPRAAGHKAGLAPVRMCVNVAACAAVPSTTAGTARYERFQRYREAGTTQISL